MKSNLKVIALSILGIILLGSCSRDKKRLESHLNNINAKGFSKVDLYEWTIMHSYSDNNYISYSLNKKKLDTIIKFDFKYYNKNDKYVIEKHNKFYQEKSDGFFYSLELGKDTLYSYKMKDLSSNVKFFIVGKYYYQYKFNQFTIKQKKYFEKHRDSLTKVRGNNLPELQELD